MSNSMYLRYGPSRNEQLILEDIIVESIKHMGTTVYYIPRSMLGKDELFGEDRISEFKHAFGIEMYLETPEGFNGGGTFMSKFGIQMELSASFTVAHRTWEKAIGRFGVTTIPGRPLEGDLIYFPLSDILLEIKYVDYQNIFYQLNKLYVYRLEVETFQYSSEKIDTGNNMIDSFESLKSYDTDPERTEFGMIVELEITNPGALYTRAPDVHIHGAVGAEITAIIGNGEVIGFTIVDGGYGVNRPEDVTITIDPPTNPAGTAAEAIVKTVKTNVDMSHSYGDNNKLKKEAKSILTVKNNPFGELK